MGTSESDTKSSSNESSTEKTTLSHIGKSDRSHISLIKCCPRRCDYKKLKSRITEKPYQPTERMHQVSPIHTGIKFEFDNLSLSQFALGESKY